MNKKDLMSVLAGFTLVQAIFFVLWITSESSIEISVKALDDAKEACVGSQAFNVEPYRAMGGGDRVRVFCVDGTIKVIGAGI